MKEYLREIVERSSPRDAVNLMREYLQARILDSLQGSGAWASPASARSRFEEEGYRTAAAASTRAVVNKAFIRRIGRYGPARVQGVGAAFHY